MCVYNGRDFGRISSRGKPQQSAGKTFAWWKTILPEVFVSLEGGDDAGDGIGCSGGKPKKRRFGVHRRGVRPIPLNHLLSSLNLLRHTHKNSYIYKPGYPL